LTGVSEKPAAAWCGVRAIGPSPVGSTADIICRPTLRVRAHPCFCFFPPPAPCPDPALVWLVACLPSDGRAEVALFPFADFDAFTSCSVSLVGLAVFILILLLGRPLST
jgi:hypothetical protein